MPRLVCSLVETGGGPDSAQPLGPGVKPETPDSSAARCAGGRGPHQGGAVLSEADSSLGARAQFCPTLSTHWSPRPAPPGLSVMSMGSGGDGAWSPGILQEGGFGLGPFPPPVRCPPSRYSVRQAVSPSQHPGAPGAPGGSPTPGREGPARPQGAGSSDLPMPQGEGAGLQGQSFRPKVGAAGPVGI